MPFGSTCVFVWRRWRVFVKRMKMNCWDKHRHSKKYIFSHLVFLSYVYLSPHHFASRLGIARRKIRIFCVVVSFQPIPRDSIFLKWNRSIVKLESSSAIALENESFFRENRPIWDSRWISQWNWRNLLTRSDAISQVLCDGQSWNMSILFDARIWCHSYARCMFNAGCK